MDLSGFNSEQQTFGGLYKLGDNLERNRVRKENELQKNENAKAANSKYLNEYFDPKEYLTGSLYDRQTGVLISDALRRAEELNSKGVPLNEITMAVSPLVNKANRYFANGKLYNQQKKAALDIASKTTGIDPDKVSQYMDDYAFPINPETGERDVEKFNPSENYADKALREGDVYNNKGFDEYVKGAGKNQYSTKLKLVNARGGYEDKDVDIIAPSFMIPDSDALGKHTGFVPKYEIAADEGQPVLHDFLGDDGNTTKAPVRIVTKEVYDSLPKSSKAFLRQEALRYAKLHNIEPTSPQVDNFQRALAYNELKSSEKVSSTFKQKEIQQENPIKIFAPRQPKAPSDAEVSQQDAINNLHLTLNDTPPDGKGNLDVSQLLNGIKFLNKYNDQIVIKEGTYNPTTKEFTLQTDKGEETIPYHRLATLAATANPGTDMKWLKGFKTYERAADANNQKVEKSKPVSFFQGIRNMVKRGAEAIKPKTTAPKSEKAPVYKGLDKDGNPIFE